ncbi:TPA: hypothetical protein DCE37_06450 [Candidatus Latescibacteria bacterium]|nr:hypothetical protein [Gemmatimonadota bacterium]HAA74740.1 hypothetical protein [Candidatus Latescibacterota bacterium]
MNAATKRKRVTEAIRAEQRVAKALSHEIHGYAERPFRERQSSEALARYLTSRGFKVEFPWKNIPTAFRAIRGTGKPAIGMLGEYDALPNCGAADGSWGHG